MKRYDLGFNNDDRIERMIVDPNGNWYRADEVNALLRECLSAVQASSGVNRVAYGPSLLELRIQSILNEGEGG